MLNKPRGYLTAMSDDRGRKCVSELVADVGCRVYPCGRLDLESEGLLLMTNDGALANRLTHPSYHIPKIYHVKVAGEVTPEQVKTLSRPMEIDGYTTTPAQVEVVTRKQYGSTLAFTLHEGRNRQIRKMCEQVGLRVITLKRIAVGQIKLGLLKSGCWKKLTKDQVAYLRTAKG
jgi:23S rRNA pseudouridine2605 synthase